MSGLDPLAALAAQAVVNAQAAMDEATLSLGADVAVLQSQISVGDVIAATVLPPQGGTDLLSFLGQTVVAQIPPGVNPGESLLLQVTGFTNTAVLVRNLGTVDPQNPVPTVDVQLPPVDPNAPQTAVLTTTLPPPSTTSATAPAQQQTPAAPGSPAPPSTVAPPREVFVAAALRAAAPASGGAQAAPLRAQPAPPIAPALETELETRMAVDRARTAPLPPPAVEVEGAAARAPMRPVVASPLLAPPLVRAAQTPPAPAPPTVATPAARSNVPISSEAALLGRLRVPVTPATLAAVRLASAATQSLTGAYERLDALLAGTPPQSMPAALRSMLAFVSRFDLRSTAALAEQIAAYVGDVVDGAETKIGQIVQTFALEETEPAQDAPPTQNTPNAAQPPLAVNIAAQAAERTAALEYDVKSALLTMLADPARGGSAPLIAALRDAVTATTAVQLNVLSAQSTNPSTITLALPAYFYPGGQPVQLQISRDAPESKKKMDGDNFHIAFILDTASLGTVAIDVQTAGRAVSVDVKTQATLAADRFRSSLGDLRTRLESLRYRVANIAAGVAPAAGAAAPASAPPSAPAERRTFWDTQA